MPPRQQPVEQSSISYNRVGRHSVTLTVRKSDDPSPQEAQPTEPFRPSWRLDFPSGRYGDVGALEVVGA